MKSIIFTAIIILYSVELSAQKKWTLNECIESLLILGILGLTKISLLGCWKI